MLFEAGNAGDLARKIAWLDAHPEVVRVLGRNARRAWEHRFTPERNLAMLRNVYALARRRFKDRLGEVVAPIASPYEMGEVGTG
jgi:glycosyltransferase involved in cell wall biosynthesis